MSGDRYSGCPKCHISHDQLAQIHKERLEAAYGKIPSREYEALRKKLSKELADAENKDESVMREDYSFSVPEIDSDGSVTINIYYGCSCEVCGFDAEIKLQKCILKRTPNK